MDEIVLTVHYIGTATEAYYCNDCVLPSAIRVLYTVTAGMRPPSSVRWFHLCVDCGRQW